MKSLALTVECVLAIACPGYFFACRRLPPQTAPRTGISTKALPSETYGLSEYTGPTYGFTFWYPSALQVTARSIKDDTDFPGGIAVESLQVGPAGGTSVVVVNSPTGSITDQRPDHASPIYQTEYFYDNTSRHWMIAFPQGTDDGSPSETRPADVSKTTISGLVMLPTKRRFNTTIIPLSTTRFLVVSDGGGSSFTQQLAQTLTPTGTSINPARQATALQAEAAAYAASN